METSGWAVSACTVVDVELVSLGVDTSKLDGATAAVDGCHEDVCVGSLNWVGWCCNSKAGEGRDDGGFGEHFEDVGLDWKMDLVVCVDWKVEV